MSISKGSSLIDHIMMRTQQTDNRPKQARTVNLGLAEWRLGRKHLPVVASIPVQRFCKLNGGKPARRQWDHWEVVRICQDCSDPRYTQLCELCKARLHQATDITSLNRLLVQCAAEIFPQPAGSHSGRLPACKVGLSLCGKPITDGSIWRGRVPTTLLQSPEHTMSSSRHTRTFGKQVELIRKAGSKDDSRTCSSLRTLGMLAP